jgi:hypothetical protein
MLNMRLKQVPSKPQSPVSSPRKYLSYTKCNIQFYKPCLPITICVSTHPLPLPPPHPPSLTADTPLHPPSSSYFPHQASTARHTTSYNSPVPHRASVLHSPSSQKRAADHTRNPYNSPPHLSKTDSSFSHACRRARPARLLRKCRGREVSSTGGRSLIFSLGGCVGREGWWGWVPCLQRTGDGWSRLRGRR